MNNICGWVKNGGKCILEQENKELKEKINTYENPEDLTLMFMYCDEKTKDKIKELKKENSILMENLIRSKTKYNNDKARYRRKAKMYRERISKAIEYIEEHLKESEVKIYGIPKCKIFMGSVEELLDLLKGDKE